MQMGCAAPRPAAPVAALALAALLGGAGQNANPAAPIAAAAGHPAHLHLQAETRRRRDGESDVATLELADGKRLERVCQADLCHGTWFDGERLATFGINGTPLPEGAEPSELRTFAAIASTAFAEPEFLAAGGSVAVLPADAAHLRYRVVAPRGAELIALADARTHRLTGVEYADGREYCRLLESTAEPVDPARPVGATGPVIVYAPRAYDRVIVAPEPLAAPAGPQVTVADSSPIGLLAPDLPIVPCTLLGHRLACLVDTGSTPSALSLDAAEQLGLEPHGHIEIGGLHPYLTGVVEAGPLLLGGATFDGLRFAVIPRVREKRFDVLVGSDALSALCITFDVARRQATVAASGAPSRGRSIGITFADGRPYISVKLGERATSESMLVDTGDSATLAIGYEQYHSDMTLFTVRGMGAAVGTGGAMDALLGELAHADIGGEALDRAPISAVRGQHVGHVGYGFAAHCGRFVVDLGARRIVCGSAAGTTNASARDL